MIKWAAPLLWKCQLWRWFVVCVVDWDWVPRTWRDGLALNSGLLIALEELFRRDADWEHVAACRAERRRLERA